MKQKKKKENGGVIAQQIASLQKENEGVIAQQIQTMLDLQKKRECLESEMRRELEEKKKLQTAMYQHWKECKEHIQGLQQIHS